MKVLDMSPAEWIEWILLLSGAGLTVAGLLAAAYFRYSKLDSIEAKLTERQAIKSALLTRLDLIGGTYKLHHLYTLLISREARQRMPAAGSAVLALPISMKLWIYITHALLTWGALLMVCWYGSTHLTSWLR